MTPSGRVGRRNPWAQDAAGPAPYKALRAAGTHTGAAGTTPHLRPHGDRGSGRDCASGGLASSLTQEELAAGSTRRPLPAGRRTRSQTRSRGPHRERRRAQDRSAGAITGDAQRGRAPLPRAPAQEAASRDPPRPRPATSARRSRDPPLRAPGHDPGVSVGCRGARARR